MNRVLKALVKAGAVTVQDGRIVPTHTRSSSSAPRVHRGDIPTPGAPAPNHSQLELIEHDTEAAA